MATPDLDSPPPRRGRPGYDREQVVRIAVQLFNEQGYDATSVADLAARLGLTKSALYHHVASKEAILQSALDDALGALEGALAEALATQDAAIDRLRHVVRGAVRVLTERLPEVTLLLRVRGNSDAERSALERRRAFDQRVTAIVRDAQREGALADDIDAAVATRLVFGMVNSLTEWYRPGGAVDPDRLADDVLRVALDGLDRPAAP
ncbi:TetR family transcriptional regulator [Microbacterium aurum]|uniref:TetR family transcriptional regulator n=1 Tax=Microbacterium aurum TaxID=36805 RepID=A0A1P8UB56_9MICO|nr:TetR/AcrR family transcriptional regulator [Microbacterium aurum]APZ35351.1 TetR family transcriptional regulator [Microbacterium aurum]MBM7826001.1 AcrR family transcriptional regulator [Microbacterium aurum]